MNLLRACWSNAIRHIILERLLLILLLGLLAAYSFLGIARVPFHPDESTQLYMSSDF